MATAIHMPHPSLLERSMETVGIALVKAAERSRGRRAARRGAEADRFLAVRVMPSEDVAVRAWRSGIR